LDEIKAMRIKVSNELAEVISEFGPKLYDDFNEVTSQLFSAKRGV